MEKLRTYTPEIISPAVVEEFKDFINILYRATSHPDNPRVKGFKDGSNCQRFAVDVLRGCGFTIPHLRSLELWQDNPYTYLADQPEKYDLVFFTPDWETDMRFAHVGVIAEVNNEGNFWVIHNSKEVGRSKIWSLNRFAQTDRYRVLRGIKRPARLG
ncbi:CHAP domain-containing protein [Candidatus Microgenomates bacterium]|nr:CHAP domain-containing protein [Candidatus Microgenomates bacterium]